MSQRYFALVATKGGKKEQYLLEKYSEFLDWAESVDEPARDRAFSNNCLIAEQFEAYVEALISSGDSETIPKLCERLAPHWNYLGGYSRLGNAAHRAGRLDLAEKWFEKIAEEVEHRHFDPDMCLLVEILHRRGATEKAKELLIDCLRKLASEIREAKNEMQQSRARQMYRVYREAYLKLFPDGPSELEEKGLPENPSRGEGG